jgi:uncharacterized protein YndB with AHSA1/START domain/uncharacterized damage-inducible protein DinB
MAEERSIRVSQRIDAAPEAIFRALTHPLDLAQWFSHYAWTDPRPQGEFLVRWRNGWWAQGVYGMVERPRRIELTWKGKDEPGESDLVFEIDSTGEAVEVRVTHSGFGRSGIWEQAMAEAERSWPRALDNLASVLTTGIDQRITNRPVLGIVPEALTAERAYSENINATRGLYLADVLPESGAAKAGLQRGDVITAISGLSVSDYDSLVTTLTPYEAGDRVQVKYVRGHSRDTTEVELQARPIVDIPFDPQRTVDRAQETHAAALEQLRRAVAGLSDEDASKKPAPGEWSVKEILAHLSADERAKQHWFADVIAGNTAGQFDENPTALPELVTMTMFSAPTVEALLARLEIDMSETRALFGSLRPEIVSMKGRYRAMAEALLNEVHYRGHARQIKDTIEAIHTEG